MKQVGLSLHGTHAAIVAGNGHFETTLKNCETAELKALLTRCKAHLHEQGKLLIALGSPHCLFRSINLDPRCRHHDVASYLKQRAVELFGISEEQLLIRFKRSDDREHVRVIAASKSLVQSMQTLAHELNLSLKMITHFGEPLCLFVQSIFKKLPHSLQLLWLTPRAATAAIIKNQALTYCQTLHFESPAQYPRWHRCIFDDSAPIYCLTQNPELAPRLGLSPNTTRLLTSSSIDCLYAAAQGAVLCKASRWF